MHSRNINKRSLGVRCILLALAVSVVLPVLSLSIFADNKGTFVTTVSKARFCSEELTAYGAYVDKHTDETVTLVIDSKSPRVSMAFKPLMADTEANALRIVIKNDSKCDRMILDYVYKNSAHLSETGVADIAINSDAVSKEYIIPLRSVDRMTKLDLTFEGGDSTGTITIVSIGAISYCYEDREYYGELTSNTYDRDSQMAEFSGTVSYETVLKYPDAKIVLYRLNQNEVIEDIRFAHPYVKSAPMSLNFRFTFFIESTSESCSRYVAAILTADNKVLPLTSETYLKEKSTLSDGAVDEVSSKDAFKGIETNFYEGASENGTSVAFVDVHLDKMFSESGNGYQYILDEGKEYYFDRSYISSLDAEISNYSSVGVSVYLRFLVDTFSPAFGHLERISVPGKAKYFAINPQDDETVNNVFACADFIASRYSSKEYGTLSGVVLGRSLDKAFEYNHCGAVSMNKYADMLARTYSIIRIALDRSNAELKVVLPVSDKAIGTDVVVTAENRDKSYPADLLTRLVLHTLDRYGTDVSSLYFMLESDHSSVSFDGESMQMPNGVMGVNGCGAFIDEIKDLSKKYDNLPDEIFYCWFPSGSLTAKQILGTYVYNYNVLANMEKVKSYIISSFERDELIDTRGYAETAENFIFSTLKSTYKYADTYSNKDVSSFALSAIGVSGWSDVIEGFDEAKVVKRNLIEQNLLYSRSDSVKGSYLMWDFSVANGTNGWDMSNGCRSLSVYTPSDDIERSLVASFDFRTQNTLGSDYASVVYRAPDSLLMKDVSSVSFELVIPGAEQMEGRFEVKITVGADNAISESTGVLKSDELAHVYADISALDKVSYIKIGVRPLNASSVVKGLFCIKGISIHSNAYNDKELENKVLSGDIIDKEENSPENDNNTAYDVVITVIAVSVLGVFGAWMTVLIFRKHSQNEDCA